jgi:hypothetical protein
MFLYLRSTHLQTVVFAKKKSDPEKRKSESPTVPHTTAKR